MTATKKTKSTSVTRNALLEAAGRVMVAHGSKALTLEAVAREAGVSKGGLLYHFPNKEALIAGMLQQLIDQKAASLEDELEQDDAPNTPGHWLRAYIRSHGNFDAHSSAIQFSLLAAVAENPELLQPAQENFADCQRQIEASGLDPAIATVIRLAINGLSFAHLFGLGVPEESLQKQVIETLLKLARE
ncbi:TetR/AcrR family transcriptional regulator [Nostoc sp. 'Peltigera membranacea cyanobiont' N6]|uniref:TetR/AcrR family transcriptional regulator n=1 Tax=Nostoc sp. 'Peltigera membranacea cyanobiont' N6 TaxID=1261031 RepID=UPI000CF322A2|nr:TetR family transcriptional regulator [Nostoc sp. 'Peltigera membranacea cyanobiont' N6]AVH67692.1 TetR family transcriptional regulator [Nostoc sp. 'Peltigera membranacea cyanobiont' N6]